MTALVGREVKSTFSGFVRDLTSFRQTEADKPEGEQAAQFGAALGGRHPVGRERVRAFHVRASLARDGYVREKPVARPDRDIASPTCQEPNPFQF